MDATRLTPLDRPSDHQPRHLEHVLQLPALRLGKLPWQHVATPALDRFERLSQGASLAFYADVPPHERPQ